ncbi:MAG: YdcF family protein [Coriobacteriia bacterium]|nr:YdcF family protein [Coriobacteriia bacterium]
MQQKAPEYNSSGQSREKRRFGIPATLLLAFARGVALFIALYALLSSLGVLLGNHYNQNVWWIDLTQLPLAAGVILQAALIIALSVFAFHVPRSLAARIGGALICLIFAVLAFYNTAEVFQVRNAGGVTLGFPLPFSFFIALAFLLLTFVYFFGNPLLHGKARKGAQLKPRRKTTITIMTLTVLLMGILFPWGQIYCFGTTDYKNPVDATVVLGAQVYPNGTPSRALADRLDAAIRLYKLGETPILIMSGGIDSSGVSEAVAMRDYAIRQGVPESAILIDEYGNNTEATARNTIKLCEQYGYEHIGAVSSFYHMARIKMLFLANGHDVYTRPAPINPLDRTIFPTMLREIPGWWYYWFSNIFI